jgi:hypothetical protein
MSKAGKELNKFEDPLVCSLCGSPEIICLDGIGNTCYCKKCDSWRNILDKTLLSKKRKPERLKHWREKAQSKEKLNKKEEEKLRETIHAAEKHNCHKKKARLIKIANQFGYKVVNQQ